MHKQASADLIGEDGLGLPVMLLERMAYFVSVDPFHPATPALLS
ncbi:hypothetical protein [Nitrosospira sp. Nsp14]|nr:hypothetical protein [Nitrosospira sp. Nsp14]